MNADKNPYKICVHLWLKLVRLGTLRRNALLELGGVEQVEERVREIRMGRFIETVWRDVRTGVRALVHSPVFTVVPVLSLALGIAPTLRYSVSSMVYCCALYPTPNRSRSLMCGIRRLSKASPASTDFQCRAANYLDWKAQSTAFEEMAVYTQAGLSLSTSNDPVPVIGAVVSADFFSVLRSNAMQGRTFNPWSDPIQE